MCFLFELETLLWCSDVGFFLRQDIVRARREGDAAYQEVFYRSGRVGRYLAEGCHSVGVL